MTPGGLGYVVLGNVAFIERLVWWLRLVGCMM